MNDILQGEHIFHYSPEYGIDKICELLSGGRREFSEDLLLIGILLCSIRSSITDYQKFWLEKLLNELRRSA